MTAKKKPRTGGDGASSNSLHGDDGSWGELSITAILRPGREHRKTTGAGGLSHTPRRDDGWAVPACRGPGFRAGFDAIMSGWVHGAAAWCRPRAQ